MRSTAAILASVMLVLTLWSGMAHAAEAVGCGAAIVTEHALHTPGDADEVPADADRNYPHHHGASHDHHVAEPATLGPVLAAIGATAGTSPCAPDKLAGGEPATMLRPPRT